MLLRMHNFRARVDLLERIAERLSPATTFSLLVGLLGWAQGAMLNMLIYHVVQMGASPKRARSKKGLCSRSGYGANSPVSWAM